MDNIVKQITAQKAIPINRKTKKSSYGSFQKVNKIYLS